METTQAPERTGFTPGPWRAVEHGEPGSGWWSVLCGAWDVSHNGAADPGVVADARYSAMTPEENAANARLIAAAPMLYDALRALVGFADEDFRDDDGELIPADEGVWNRGYADAFYAALAALRAAEAGATRKEG